MEIWQERLLESVGEVSQSGDQIFHVLFAIHPFWGLGFLGFLFLMAVLRFGVGIELVGLFG